MELFIKLISERVKDCTQKINKMNYLDFDFVTKNQISRKIKIYDRKTNKSRKRENKIATGQDTNKNEQKQTITVGTKSKEQITKINENK